jgi:hypothetical protein
MSASNLIVLVWILVASARGHQLQSTNPINKVTDIVFRLWAVEFMRRTSEKILIGLILSTFLLATFLEVEVPVKAASGSVEIEVSVRGSYLYVDPRDNSGVESPGVADLQTNGILKARLTIMVGRITIH